MISRGGGASLPKGLIIACGKATDAKERMAAYFRYIGLILVSLFFLAFGIHVLLAAYRLNDPHTFIMTFFASNFIILISGALIVGLILRLRHNWQSNKRSSLSAGKTAAPCVPPLTDEDHRCN